jgi:hypothetical protein
MNPHGAPPLIPTHSNETSTFQLWLAEPNAPVNHTLLAGSSLDSRHASIRECLERLDAVLPPSQNTTESNQGNRGGTRSRL